MDEHMELLVELMRKTIEQKDEQIQKLNETIEETAGYRGQPQ